MLNFEKCNKAPSVCEKKEARLNVAVWKLGETWIRIEHKVKIKIYFSKYAI